MTVVRDTLDVDILIVGAGPAGVAAALRLAQLRKQAGAPDLTVVVLEKAREAGAHLLSGAVLDPSALRALVPDFEARGAPLAAPVRGDRVYFLTRRRAWPFPLVPPPLHNRGHYVVSLNRLVKWMTRLLEEEGIDVLHGFAGVEVLYDGARVIGVRTGDRGIDRQGRRKSSFEPGVDIRARVTIFADGVRGNLTKALVRQLGLAEGRQPQVYALGIKELWEVPPERIEAGTVIHTMGYPLRFEEFGGGFLYAMGEGRLAVGVVVGLDYRDPLFDPHMAFQHFKRHPFVARLLAGGQMVRYGAKALPEGGWYAIPRPYADGALIVGDAAGFVNAVRLKGIHLAMWSGIAAADTAFDAVRAGDVSASRLQQFQARIEEGPIRRELYPVRNVHQSFACGLPAGLAYAGLALVTGGWWWRDPWPARPGHERMARVADYYRGRRPPPEVPSTLLKPDRRLTFDKLTNVHFSGTRHEEDQPPHLVVHDLEICRTRCLEEYGNPCQRFCPASVYEIVDAPGGGKQLKINASNCVHCKTCDILDPYQIIDWVPPEGGGGPYYEGM